MSAWLDRGALARSETRSLDLGRAWTRTIAMRVDAAFAGVDPDDVERGAEAAARLLAEVAWCEAALRAPVAALRDDPAAAPPLRVRRDMLRTGVVLHDGAHATLSASVMTAEALAALPAAASVVASGRVSVVRYCRGGGATLRLWDAPVASGDLCADAVRRCTPMAPVALHDGMVIRLDGRTRAHLVEDAADAVVTLTATLHAGALAQAREYARDDGRLLRAAGLDESESRMRMLLTLLRVSARADAAACFDAATREPAFGLRWAAMREWLAVDARAALPRLAEMTGDANAEIRTAARATLAMVERRLAA